MAGRFLLRDPFPSVSNQVQLDLLPWTSYKLQPYVRAL